MRQVIQSQKKLGQADIANIKINLKCRDEMPKILLGLQQIYCDLEIREKVFKTLEELIPKGISPDSGRPGMELWKILVLGCVKLNCNWDYDKLHDIVNNHKTLREMLGHGIIDEGYQYNLQTLKDNVSLFTPEILEQLNRIVVGCGHRQLTLSGKKNEKLELNGRCDSFVVETDVHYPTDINLLFDAIRKVVTLISRLCFKEGIGGWRKGDYNIKRAKQLFRKAQKLSRFKSKNETRKAQREAMIKKAHQAYIELVELFLDRTEESLLELKKSESCSGVGVKISEIENYVKHAYRQIDQIRRRVIKGESIPHNEKIFSIFEEHTEWISKGKAGVPQELGLRVCILEDQYGFILHHRVMEKETDDEVAVPVIAETKKKYWNLKSCSFDKGFHSPQNQKELKDLLELLILPKKGKLTESDKIKEHSTEFLRGRQKHSGVESAINGLENHGLDRCLDRGIPGFNRYVSFAILARNIETLGSLIHKRQVKSLKSREKLKTISGNGQKLKVA